MYSLLKKIKGSIQALNKPCLPACLPACPGGGSYRILEQNWDGGNADGRVVHEATINLSYMTYGEYWIYEPVAK